MEVFLTRDEYVGSAWINTDIAATMHRRRASTGSIRERIFVVLLDLSLVCNTINELCTEAMLVIVRTLSALAATNSFRF